MTLDGTFVNGAVVFEAPPGIPDGTKVVVTVPAPAAGPAKAAVPTGSTLGERLRKLAGVVEEWPADMAQNHDHYLYGAPKQ